MNGEVKKGDMIVNGCRNLCTSVVSKFYLNLQPLVPAIICIKYR